MTTSKTKAKAVNRKRITHERVEPEDGPIEVTIAKVSDLEALGLPSRCIGGEILSDEVLDDPALGTTVTRWLEFRLLGTSDLTFGVGYEAVRQGTRAYAKPWGSATEVELTHIPKPTAKPKRGSRAA